MLVKKQYQTLKNKLKLQTIKGNKENQSKYASSNKITKDDNICNNV